MVKVHRVNTIPNEEIINGLILLDNMHYNKEFELVTILKIINGFYVYLKSK